jgi:galactokinase
MNASHQSCRDLFECSCEALDATVDECLSKGCLAARLTGAGSLIIYKNNIYLKKNTKKIF